VELAKDAARLAARASECTKDDDKFLARLEALGAWGTALSDSATTASGIRDSGRRAVEVA
jgi:hypothetical protein